jgi:hypothetical protein
MTTERKDDPKESSPIEVVALKEEKTIHFWKTLARPYQKKDREFWTTILATLGLVCLILFFVKEWFLIAAFLGLVFLYYVLTTVKPEEVNYKITNKGVYLPGGEEKVDWDVLSLFWISEKWGFKILNLETRLNFPKVIHLVIKSEEEGKIKEIVSKYLSETAIKKNFTDKLSEWIIRQLPVGKTKSSKK